MAKRFEAHDTMFLQPELRAVGFLKDSAGDWWYHPELNDASATAAYEAAWFRAMKLAMAEGFGYYMFDPQGSGASVTFYPFCSPGG